MHPWWVSVAFQNSQKKLAEKVKSARHALGLSQEAMAHEAEIDRTYASQIERGIGNPSLRVICSLAKVLKVEPRELF